MNSSSLICLIVSKLAVGDSVFREWRAKQRKDGGE
jgi:hypothetical protein